MNNEKVTINYLLNEEGRKDSILKNQGGKEINVIKTEVTDRILKLARVNEDGSIYLNVGFCGNNDNVNSIILNYKELKDDIGIYIEETQGIVGFDKVMDGFELIEWEEKRRELIETKFNSYESLLKERDETIKKRDEEIKKEFEKSQIKQEEKNHRERIEHEEKRQQGLERGRKFKKSEEIKKRVYTEERNCWIQEKGSQYLKDCIRLDYNIDSKYVIERAKIEHPEYTVDIDSSAYYNQKSNPGKGALEEVVKLVKDGHDAEVIWLTSFDEDEDDDENYEYIFEECEAIIIKDYLEYYDLIKML